MPFLGIRVGVPGTYLGRASGGGANLNVKWTAEGDSITFGLGGQPAYPPAALSLLSGVASTPNTNTPTVGAVPGVGTVTLNDIATSGISALTINQNYSTRFGASFDATKDLNLLSLMIGTNTSGSTDTTPLQKYVLNRSYFRKAELTALAAGKPLRKVLCAMIARDDGGSGGWTGTLVPLNAFFSAYYNSDLRCDAYVRFDSDSRFNDPTAIPTSIWYNPATDLVHPSILGEGPTGMGGIAAPVILSALQAAGAIVQVPTYSIFDFVGTIALSNSNRTATGAGQAMGFPAFKTGKRYFEDDCTTIGASSYFGLASENWTIPGSDLFSSVEALGYIQDGRIMVNNVVLATGATFTTGDTRACAVNFDTKLAWVSRIRAGVRSAWNAGGSADPVTGVGGVSIASFTTPWIHPAVSQGTGSVTLSRYAAAELVGTAPTGFLASDQ